MTDQENEWIMDLPLSKQGSSLGVCIPKKVLTQLGLGHGDKVRIILYKKSTE